jgi:hypothetical protein
MKLPTIMMFFTMQQWGSLGSPIFIFFFGCGCKRAKELQSCHILAWVPTVANNKGNSNSLFCVWLFLEEVGVALKFLAIAVLFIV